MHSGGLDNIVDRALRTPADTILSNSKTGRDESPSGVQIPPLSATQSRGFLILREKAENFRIHAGFFPSRDPEKRRNSHHCDQIRRLISAGSEVGSLQVISAAGQLYLSQHRRSNIRYRPSAPNILRGMAKTRGILA
jgi:hypothetical protein